jgi:hypothetical protein
MEYSEQSLRLSFGEILAGIGWLHSKRLAGSKCSHCLHACRSNPHFGHCPTGCERFCSSAPHSAQRETVRVPGMLMGRGPNVFSFFGAAAGFSNSFFAPPPESWYPRCRYLRSDKQCLLKTASRSRSLSAFGAPGTSVSLVPDRRTCRWSAGHPRPAIPNSMGQTPVPARLDSSRAQ